MLVIVLVLLLYRRIGSIGRISLFLWAGVIGTILWLIWGGVTHFQPKLVFTYAPGAWDFVVAVFRDAGLGDGEHHLHVLGLLQHLSSGR